MPPGSIFTAQDSLVVPTSRAGGPWDPSALHGGAAAALIVSELERMQPQSELRFGKLSFELLRPIPSAPLTLTTSVVKAGRRVQELAAELRNGEELVCSAKALKALPVQADVLQHAVTSRAAHPLAPPLPPPHSDEAKAFVVDGPLRASFASAVEMRWLTRPWAMGPAKLWMRLLTPVLPDRPITPLTTLAAITDFGNGVAAELRFDRFIFINADLTVHLQREPSGEWIGLDARTLLEPEGAGLAESVIHDLDGPIGRAFQTLVVQPR